MVLREVIGGKDLDDLLTQKNLIAQELLLLAKQKTSDFGIEIKSMGIRDIILPGEMKEILNKVMEANLIVRREEVAATRGQSNTAKMMENNPMLMRLKELEILEKISKSGQLNLFMGDKDILSSLHNYEK